MTPSGIVSSSMIKILLLSTLTCKAGSSNFDYFLTHPCRTFVRITSRRHQRTEFLIHNDLLWIKSHPKIKNCTFEINLRSVYAVNATLSTVPVYLPLIRSEKCNFNVEILTGVEDRVSEEIACGVANQKTIQWPWNRVVVNFVLNLNQNTSTSDYIFVISAVTMDKQLVGRIWTSTKIKLPEENGTSICIDSKPFYYYLVYNEHWPYGQINHDVMVKFHIKSDVSLCIKSYSLPVTDQCYWNVNIKMNHTQLIRIGCMDVSDYWCLPWSVKNSRLDFVWTASGLYKKASIFSLRVISNNSIPNLEQDICSFAEIRSQPQTEPVSISQSVSQPTNDNDKSSYNHIDMHLYVIILLIVLSLALLILTSLAVKMVRNRKRQSACCTMTTATDQQYTESQYMESQRSNHPERNLEQLQNEADNPPEYTVRWTNQSYMEIPNNEHQIVTTVVPTHEVFYQEDPPLYTSQDNLNAIQSNIDTSPCRDSPPTYSIHSDHSNSSGRTFRLMYPEKPPPYEDVCS